MNGKLCFITIGLMKMVFRKFVYIFQTNCDKVDQELVIIFFHLFLSHQYWIILNVRSDPCLFSYVDNDWLPYSLRNYKEIQTVLQEPFKSGLDMDADEISAREEVRHSECRTQINVVAVSKYKAVDKVDFPSNFVLFSFQTRYWKTLKLYARNTFISMMTLHFLKTSQKRSWLVNRTIYWLVKKSIKMRSPKKQECGKLT